MQFLSMFDTKYKAVVNAQDDHTYSEPPEDWLVPVWDKLQSVRLVSHNSTVQKAEKAATELRDLTYGAGRWEHVDLALDHYLGAIREEFHLAPITLMDD